VGVGIGLGLEVGMREILVEQQSDGSWMAACRGPLRAIVVESDTGWAAEIACYKAYCQQQADYQTIAKLEKGNE